MGDRIWLNGSLVPPEEATVSVFDHGLTVGDGVFETIKATDGMPFAVRRHLERLRRSAAGLGLEVPYSDDELRSAIAEVLAGRPAPLARVRLTVTGGASPLGSDRGEAPATVIVVAAPQAPAGEPTRVCTVPWPRNERSAIAGLKTTSYAENVVALAYAKERGCSEALYSTTTGLLCEGTGANVFLVHDGRLITPTLATGCLAGVTRALVLEVTEAEEADLPISALAEADEVFITSSTRDVQPVEELDSRSLGPPGPRTRESAEAFAALAASNPDP